MMIGKVNVAKISFVEICNSTTKRGDMNKSYNRFTFQLDALGNKSKAEDIELSIFFQHKNYTVLIIY